MNTCQQANGDMLVNCRIVVGLGGGSVVGNTAIGRLALLSNTTGDNNTALGYKALCSNTTGIDNTAIGSCALVFNMLVL